MNFFETTTAITFGSLGIALILTVILTSDLGCNFYSKTLETLREKYHILRYIWIIAGTISAISLCANFAASPKSSRQDDDKGYWGSDGYYHPTDREIEQSIREAEEWIKNN